MTVVVWVRKATNYQAIRAELLELAVDDPYESTEYQGMVDFHWGFDRMSKADQLASSLRVFAEKPEVVVLRIAPTAAIGASPSEPPGSTHLGHSAFALGVALPAPNQPSSAASRIKCVR